jgi:hypothetical protein
VKPSAMSTALTGQQTRHATCSSASKAPKTLPPAAFCTVEKGRGDYMNQKWLSCEKEFDYLPNAVDIYSRSPPGLILSSPLQMHTACLKNPKGAGFRIKNGQTSRVSFKLC